MGKAPPWAVCAGGQRGASSLGNMSRAAQQDRARTKAGRALLVLASSLRQRAVPPCCLSAANPLGQTRANNRMQRVRSALRKSIPSTNLPPAPSTPPQQTCHAAPHLRLLFSGVHLAEAAAPPLPSHLARVHGQQGLQDVFCLQINGGARHTQARIDAVTRKSTHCHTQARIDRQAGIDADQLHTAAGLSGL